MKESTQKLLILARLSKRSTLSHREHLARELKKARKYGDSIICKTKKWVIYRSNSQIRDNEKIKVITGGYCRACQKYNNETNEMVMVNNNKYLLRHKDCIFKMPYELYAIGCTGGRSSHIESNRNIRLSDAHSKNDCND